MVEKVNALCKAIDTLNSLPKDENTDARLAELSEMLLAECKQMVQKPVKQCEPTCEELRRSYEAAAKEFAELAQDPDFVSKVYGVPPLQAALEQLELLKKIEKGINGPASDKASALLDKIAEDTKPPAKQFFAGKNISSGEPLMFEGDYVYPIPSPRPYDKDIDNPLTPPR